MARARTGGGSFESRTEGIRRPASPGAAQEPLERRRTRDEPLLAQFSAAKAAKYLEAGAHSLERNCFACHGPDKNKRKADLRLDTEEGAYTPRGETKTLTPGNPAASVVFPWYPLRRQVVVCGTVPGAAGRTGTAPRAGAERPGGART